MNKVPYTIKRINNACVLISIGEHNILTDPYFVDIPFIGVTELAVIEPKDLPVLTAIIGCHEAVDHWQMKGMEDYPHNKDEVQLFVAMQQQVDRAKEAGFNNVEVLAWGEKRVLKDNLTIECVEAQKMLRWTVNNYVIKLEDTSIFFGSEARDLAPIEKYASKNKEIDMAIFPVNGVYLMSFYQLVMRGEEAVQGAKALGAKHLFVVHDYHKSRPFFLPIKSSAKDAIAEAKKDNLVNVINIPAGQIWSSQTSD